jgi:hypothetical protein
MKNKELFDRTIGILVKGFMNDTMEYTDCTACAVGNLIAYNNGMFLRRGCFGIESVGGESDNWSYVIKIGSGQLMPSWNQESNKQTLIQMANTGYTPIQLAAIELAFSEGYSKLSVVDLELKDRNFSGLMSVVDTLMLIHEANETEVKQAKELFVLS